MAVKATKHLEQYAFATSEMECVSDMIDSIASCLNKSRSRWTSEQLSELAERMDGIEKSAAALKDEVIHLMAKY